MKTSGSAFEGLLGRYFEQLLADNPVFATMLAGLREAEGKLGSASARFHEKRERARQRVLRDLEAVSPHELASEQHLDRLALRSLVLRETEDHARGRHAIEPNAPEQVLNILVHELQRGDDEPRRAAANLRSLLRQVPAFLGEAADVVKTPERVWLGIMEQAVAGAPALLDSVQAFFQTAGPLPADQALVAGAKKAIALYGNRVRNLPLAPAGSFAIGPEVLQRRVRDELGLDYTLGQLETLALSEAARIGQSLQRTCASIGRGRSPGELLAQLRSQWRPAKPLLQLYQDETRRVAKAFAAAKAVTFPVGDELVVKPVPEFLRATIATAAYNPPGAFDKKQRGVFWVKEIDPATVGSSEALAEEQQHFGVPLTCAHEAYPGHHLQFVTANRHPRKWRRLFAHAVFYEGWTLWCEQMTIDLGIERGPWAQLQQLHDALWRCHRILVDIRLQTGRYTAAQAARHLRKYLGFTPGRSEAEVNWYTTQPAVPMSYWLGRLENDRLRRRLVEGRGWTLRRFNDWLLSFGTIPQGWIEKYGLD